MKKREKRQLEAERIETLIGGLSRDEKVREMKNYLQHGRITTYDHCFSVARRSYRINRSLHLHADEKVLLTSAMLHDFFLYDWHVGGGTNRLHGYHHADTAMENARKYFDIGAKEQSAIWSHMWPLNITRVPKSREAWIICLADKLCSIEETVFKR